MMRARASSLIIVGSLVLAGCVGGGSEPSVTGTAGNATETTGLAATTEAPASTLVDPATTTAPATVDFTTTSTTHAPGTTARTEIDSLASGLFCRDLASLGYNYSEAVAYWIGEGSRDRMDADLDGIPCETV